MALARGQCEEAGARSILSLCSAAGAYLSGPPFGGPGL
jgi:hypothetical protein